MVREAEAHAEEDRRFHELVSARNQAEAMVHTAHQTLRGLGEQGDSAAKSASDEILSFCGFA
jgi:molecular chaperone DnaK